MAELTPAEQTRIRRLRRAARVVDLASAACWLAIGIVLLAGGSGWVGLTLLLTGAALYPMSWRLSRVAAEVQWQAIWRGREVGR